jgi:hypothetical protein
MENLKGSERGRVRGAFRELTLCKKAITEVRIPGAMVHL